MSFYEDDAAAFMDANEFAVVATVPAGNLLGILLEPYAESFGMVAGSQPAFIVPSSSLVVPSPAVGDVLTVGGRSFAITGFEPDGTGITRISLEAH